MPKNVCLPVPATMQKFVILLASVACARSEHGIGMPLETSHITPLRWPQQLAHPRSDEGMGASPQSRMFALFFLSLMPSVAFDSSAPVVHRIPGKPTFARPRAVVMETKSLADGLTPAEEATLLAVQERVGLKESEVRRILKQVPDVKGYSFDGGSLTALQNRLDLTDAELKAVVLRLPQVLGESFEATLEPSLVAVQDRLQLSDEELSFVVKKLPQILGLDFKQAIEPCLRNMQEKLKVSDAELKAEVLAKPAELLKAGLVVRGGTKGPKGKAAQA